MKRFAENELKITRLRNGGGKTAYELVKEGKGDAVLQHLDSIELGGFA